MWRGSTTRGRKSIALTEQNAEKRVGWAKKREGWWRLHSHLTPSSCWGSRGGHYRIIHPGASGSEPGLGVQPPRITEWRESLSLHSCPPAGGRMLADLHINQSWVKKKKLREKTESRHRVESHLPPWPWSAATPPPFGWRSVCSGTLQHPTAARFWSYRAQGRPSLYALPLALQIVAARRCVTWQLKGDLWRHQWWSAGRWSHPVCVFPDPGHSWSRRWCSRAWRQGCPWSSWMSSRGPPTAGWCPRWV